MKPPIEAVAHAYRDRLYAAAFSACRNPQDAEDAVQDALIQYWARREEFETEQHLRAWLLRVAINRAKNRARSFFRRNVVPLEDYMESLSFETEEDSGLFQAVMALPARYRVAIHLFYYEDYSVQEIADILHITPGNVKTRLSRGRAALRGALQEAWNNDEW